MFPRKSFKKSTNIYYVGVSLVLIFLKKVQSLNRPNRSLYQDYTVHNLLFLAMI